MADLLLIKDNLLKSVLAVTVGVKKDDR